MTTLRSERDRFDAIVVGVEHAHDALGALPRRPSQSRSVPSVTPDTARARRNEQYSVRRDCQSTARLQRLPGIFVRQSPPGEKENPAGWGS